MPAGTIPLHKALTIEQAFVFPVTFTLYEDEARTTPVPLTGYDAEFTVRTLDSEGTLVLRATTSNYLTITPAAGKIACVVPGSVTDTIPAFAEGWCELRIWPAGDPDNATKPVSGYIKCTRYVGRT